MFQERSGLIAHDTLRKHSPHVGTDLTWGATHDGTTALFNGSSTKLVNTTFPTDLTSEISVEAQVITTNQVGWRNIIQRANNWYLETNGASVRPRVYPSGALVGSNIDTDVPVHILMTYDGRVVRLYINGEADVTQSQVAAIGSTGQVNIGAFNAGSEWWTGSMQHIRVWNRALSAKEAWNLYQDPYGMYVKNKYDFLISIGGVAYQKTLSDTVGITDTITPAVGYTKSISDNIGISDSIYKSVGYLKSISDSVGITDAITKSVGYVKTISDTVGITDLLSRVVNYVRTISDTVGITDVLNRVVNYIKTIADTVGITDILSIPDLGEFVEILSVEFEDYIINDIDVSDNIEQAISAEDYIILNIQSEGTT